MLRGVRQQKSRTTGHKLNNRRLVRNQYHNTYVRRTITSPSVSTGKTEETITTSMEVREFLVHVAKKLNIPENNAAQEIDGWTDALFRFGAPFTNVNYLQHVVKHKTTWSNIDLTPDVKTTIENLLPKLPDDHYLNLPRASKKIGPRTEKVKAQIGVKAKIEDM